MTLLVTVAAILSVVATGLPSVAHADTELTAPGTATAVGAMPFDHALDPDAAAPGSPTALGEARAPRAAMAPAPRSRSAASSPATAPRAVPSPGLFSPVPPARVLDTRHAVGVPTTTPVLQQQTVAVLMAGRAGLPADGISAVVVNLTVTETQAAGYLTAYASGGTRPGTSNLNWLHSQTIAHSAIVPVGSDGRIAVFNGSPNGSVQIIVDVSGYVLRGGTATPGAYVPLPPTRVVDTRLGLGASGSSGFGRNETMVFHLGGTGGLPATGVTTVVLNVTVTQPAASGYVTVTDRRYGPYVSNLNWSPGQTVSNVVMTPLDGQGDVWASFTSTSGGHVIIDVAGYVVPGAIHDAGALRAVTPARLLDTRDATGRPGTAAVPPNGALDLAVTAPLLGTPGLITTAVLNVTATQPTAAGYLTVTPTGGSGGGTSDLNWLSGQTVANLVTVPVGADGRVHLHTSSSGSVHLLADLVGYVVAHDYPTDPEWSNQSLDLSSVAPPAPGTAWRPFAAMCTTGHVCAVSGISDSSGRGVLDLYDGTRWQAPTAVPYTGRSDVACFGAALCVAVGGSTQWSETFVAASGPSGWNVTTPAPTAGGTTVPPRFNDVVCPDARGCLTVGESGHGVPVSMTYSATSHAWTERPVPLPVGFTMGYLWHVDCLSPTSCVAVGAVAAATYANARNFVASWDGTAWATVVVPVPPELASTDRQFLSFVSCAGVSCTVTGQAVTIDPTGSTGGVSVGVIVSGAGQNWRVSSTDTSGRVGPIRCRTTDRCVTSGPGGVAEVTASSIVPVALSAGPVSATRTFDDVSCPSSGRCVAVGRGIGNGVTDNGTLLTRADTGWSTPTLVPTPASEVETIDYDYTLTSSQRLTCGEINFCLLVGSYPDAAGGRSIRADFLGGS